MSKRKKYRQAIETVCSICEHGAHMDDSYASCCTSNVNLCCESSLGSLEGVNATNLEFGKPIALSINTKDFMESVDEGASVMTESASYDNEFLECCLNRALKDTEEADTFFENSFDESFDEVSVTLDSEKFDICVLSSFAESTFNCSVNETSTQYMEQKEELSSYVDHMDLSSDLPNWLSKRDDKMELDMEASISSSVEEFLPCFVNEIPIDYMDKTEESTDVSSSSDSSDSEASDGVPNVRELEAEEFSSSHNEHQHCFIEASNCRLVSGSEIDLNQLVTQVNDTTSGDTLQCGDTSNESYRCISVLESTPGDAAEDNLIGEVPTDDSQVNNCINEEGHSSVQETSSVSVGEGKNSLGICSSSVKSAMRSLENNHCGKEAFPPKVLFSEKKVKSPSSQEKLCEDNNSDRLFDNVEITNYKRKLWFEKRTNASTTGTCLTNAELLMGRDGMLTRLKNDSNVCLQSVSDPLNSSLHVSCIEPAACTECTLYHSNAQKALRFSLRLMHDMECFVMKLMGGLKYVESIAGGNLHPQCCPSAAPPSKDKPNEQMRRIALNTLNLEEATRKWHFLMVKDWNRFCRVVSLSGDASTNSSPHKRQKKLKFADEAGGSLCKVKFFRKNMPPVDIGTKEKDHWAIS